jgi:hypothetical protein
MGLWVSDVKFPIKTIINDLENDVSYSVNLMKLDRKRERVKLYKRRVSNCNGYDDAMM